MAIMAFRKKGDPVQSYCLEILSVFPSGGQLCRLPCQSGILHSKMRHQGSLLKFETKKIRCFTPFFFVFHRIFGLLEQ